MSSRRTRAHVEAWEQFDHDNPQVWELFERFTLEAIHGGARRLGARLVWERMRWYSRVESTDRTFKLNNNYPQFYARKFLEHHPEHAGCFQLRGEDPPDPQQGGLFG